MTVTPILAYLDAGSTSLIFAAIASGAAGIRFFLKAKLSKFRQRNDDTEAGVSQEAQADHS